MTKRRRSGKVSAAEKAAQRLLLQSVSQGLAAACELMADPGLVSAKDLVEAAYQRLVKAESAPLGLVS